jgi:hypothetical protein
MANLSNINGKFVVDTAGNIGVGTLIPRSDANTTNISIQSSGTARLFVNNTGASGKEYAIYSSANGDFGIFDYGAVSARLVIDSSGNSTFAGNVRISKTDATLEINNSTGSLTNADLYISVEDTGQADVRQYGAYSLAFWTNNAQRLTINSGGKVIFNVSGGTITTIGSDIAMTQGAIGLRINDAASAISPTTATSNNDNAVDLGVSNIRFRNLYMGGTGTFGGNVTTNTAVIALGSLPALQASSIFIDSPTTTINRLGVTGANTTTKGTFVISQYSSDGSVGADSFNIDSSGNVGIGVTPNNGNGGLEITKTGGTFANANQKRVASFYDGSVNANRPGIILGYDDSSTPHGIVAARTQTGSGTIPGLQFFTYDGGWGPRMTILNTGNVGIGNSPASDAKLEVWNGNLRVRGDQNAVIQLTNVAGNTKSQLGNAGNEGDLSLYTSGNIKTVYLSSYYDSYINPAGGNVGIGITNPQDKLHVNGDAIISSTRFGDNATASINTTGIVVANVVASTNGQSAVVEFIATGGAGAYYNVVYTCYNGAGNWYYTKNVVGSGGNIEVAETNGSGSSTLVFYFRATSGVQGYTPRVMMKASPYNLVTF